MTDKDSPSLHYSRRLFSNILDWYKNADTKAQILLTLAGVFLSFLVSTIFTKKDDIRAIIDLFGIETWVLLSLMAAFLTATVVSALICLRSMLADPEDIDKHLDGIVNNGEMKDRQWPETMWFFGMIAQLKDRRRFQARINEFTFEDEIHALSSQIFIVSKNVLKKHKWVNRGFLFITLTLLTFLASGVSYIIRAKTSPDVTNDKLVITIPVDPKLLKPNQSIKEGLPPASANPNAIIINLR